MNAPSNNKEPGTRNQEPTPLLQFHDIFKSFFGVRILKGITFALQQGHVLGLVGENGAGKSTLMNLLGGNLQLDDGQMLLDGQPYAPRSPRDAEAHGIAFVHQELNLFTNLTIAENLFLTDFPTTGGLIRRSAIQSRTAELLAQVGLDLPADTLVERLSAGERQLVEIAKALSIDARVILFDEPTTSLTARETEHLFGLIARLRERGLSMFYISHALNDVLRLCDDIVVLRDGEVVGQGPRADFTADRMIALMVGREITQLFPERSKEGRLPSRCPPQRPRHPSTRRGEGHLLRVAPWRGARHLGIDGLGPHRTGAHPLRTGSDGARRNPP
jgi:ribose transport system ATP-binding protein